MREIKLLMELIQKKNIKLIDPSKDISDSYAQKSENTLKATKILIEQNLLEEAISMLYYSMYNKTISLLYLTGIKCENHSATIIILKELFKINNQAILFAKKERIEKQYYTDFKITKEDVISLIASAEEFNANLDQYIDLLTIENKIRLYKEFKETYF